MEAIRFLRYKGWSNAGVWKKNPIYLPSFPCILLKIFYFQKNQKIVDSQKNPSYHYQYIPYIREYGINNNLSEALL